MEYSNETLRDILKQDAEGKLVLPNFQRDFVWKLEKQKQLLASILVGLPIGSFLIIEGNKNDFLARRLGSTESTDPKEECKFILDGQQRLSCLRSIFDDLFSHTNENWKLEWNELYGLLRNRWFLKVNPTNDDLDIWGWKKLKYSNNLHSYDPDQVEDFIISHRVLIKDQANSSAWYHPAYKVFDRSNNEITGFSQRRTKLAKQYAEMGLIPLFEIYTKNLQPDSLHNLTLREIANMRRDELKAKVRDKEFSSEEILGHLNSDLNESSDLDTFWYELASNWVTDIRTAIEKMVDHKVIQTILPSSEIGRAAAIFETINEGGTPLSNFDLIVAKTAKIGDNSLSQSFKEFIMSDLVIPIGLSNQESEFTWQFSSMGAIKDNSIVRIVSDQFLNILSILAYDNSLRGDSQSEILNSSPTIKLEHIKQAKILNLKPDQVTQNYKEAFRVLREAFAFLQFRCGVINVNDISYKLMILPIAYLFARHPTAWNNKSLLNQLEYWYWISLFSGRFKEKQNERCIEDLKFLYQWIVNQESNPFTERFNDVLAKVEYSDKEAILSDAPSSIKQGLLQYILSKEPKDFIVDNQISLNLITKLKAYEISAGNQEIEIHHIIPLASARTVGESTKSIRRDNKSILNSPLNLTYISKSSNRTIGSFSPNHYLHLLTSATLIDHYVSQTLLDIFKNNDSQTQFDEKIKIAINERWNTLSQRVKADIENLIN